jgi:hypothetical protein
MRREACDPLRPRCSGAMDEIRPTIESIRTDLLAVLTGRAAFQARVVLTVLHTRDFQIPLLELATQIETLWLLIRKTAWEMGRMPKPEVERRLSDRVGFMGQGASR